MANGGGPGAAQRAPNKYIVFENFKKLNTAEVRQGLNEAELAWVENLQPLADNNWTTVPGPGSSLISIGQTINLIFYGVLNLPAGNVINSAGGTTDIMVVFTTAGSAWAINIVTGAATKFAPDGSFSLAPDMTPWQNSRFLFNDSIAGYCNWDGTTFVRQGGLSANIPITNGGSGYTSPPIVTISGGSGSGATAVATIGSPSVTQIILDAGGAGYSSPPTINFTGGGGAGASATANIDPRAVLSISAMDNQGAYAKDNIGPYDWTVSFSGGGGSGAHAHVSSSAVNGVGQVVVLAVALDSGGSGYSSPPTITITPNAHLAQIIQAQCHVTAIGNGAVTSINFDPTTQGGTGYTSVPTVTLTGGGGSGAAAHAIIGGAQVTHVTLTNPGQGYLPSDKDVSLGGTLQATFSGGGGSGAVAVLSVAAFIPKGTSVAVFQGRVWLNFFSGPNSSGQLNGLQWSGVNGYNDWSTANASGALVLPDTDLIHQITGVRAYNNFLWIIGDQSIKQIGNISLNQAGNVTLFTIITLSSDQGTTYLQSCQSFNRVFFFVNQNGVYAVFGSSVQKVSGDLDGIFQSCDFSLHPQGALLDIQNVHCVMWLLKYVDSVFTHTTRTILVIFNGQRWFIGSQGDNLLAMSETCTLASPNWVPYASLGSDLTPIFNNNNAQVTIRLRTALSHHQNPVQRKRTIRLGYAMTLDAGPANVTLNVDTDENTAAFTPTLQTGFQTRTLTNDPATGNGINVSGTYLGYTLTGTLLGFSLSNLRIEFQETNVGNQN